MLKLKMVHVSGMMRGGMPGRGGPPPGMRGPPPGMMRGQGKTPSVELVFLLPLKMQTESPIVNDFKTDISVNNGKILFC